MHGPMGQKLGNCLPRTISLPMMNPFIAWTPVAPRKPATRSRSGQVDDRFYPLQFAAQPRVAGDGRDLSLELGQESLREQRLQIARKGLTAAAELVDARDVEYAAPVEQYASSKRSGCCEGNQLHAETSAFAKALSNQSAPRELMPHQFPL